MSKLYLEITNGKNKQVFNAPLNENNALIATMILRANLKPAKPVLQKSKDEELKEVFKTKPMTISELNRKRRESKWYGLIKKFIKNKNKFTMKDICREYNTTTKKERQGISQALSNMKANNELKHFSRKTKNLEKGNKILEYTRKQVHDIGEYYGLPPKKYGCPKPDCNKRFRNTSILKYHLRETHNSISNEKELEECLLPKCKEMTE